MPHRYSELVDRLEAQASDFDASLAYHREKFGDYCRKESGRETSVAIVEHQLNKRDLGSESRLMREAAAALRECAEHRCDSRGLFDLRRGDIQVIGPD